MFQRILFKKVPCRFRKAGRVWCSRARETREPHVTIGRTVSKSETSQNLPAFQHLSGTYQANPRSKLHQMVRRSQNKPNWSPKRQPAA